MNSIRLRHPAAFGFVKECFIVGMHAPLRNSTENRFMQIYTLFFWFIIVQLVRNHTEFGFMKEASIAVHVLKLRNSTEIGDLRRGFFVGMRIVRELQNYTEFRFEISI